MSERGGSHQRENSYSDEVGAVGGREGNVKGVETGDDGFETVNYNCHPTIFNSK